MAARILLIGSDALLLEWLQECLAREGYLMTVRRSGGEKLCFAPEDRPHVVLLDEAITSPDSVDICRSLHQLAQIPVCLLSDGKRPGRVVDCLEAGADMYMLKTYDDFELVARVRALLRRVDANRNVQLLEAVQIGDIEVDLSARRVRKHGQVVELSNTEFSLLSVLVRNCGKLLTHRVLLTEIWGHEYINDTQYLRVYIRSLREKLEERPEEPRYLLTEWGVGYRLVADVQAMMPAQPVLMPA